MAPDRRGRRRARPVWTMGAIRDETRGAVRIETVGRRIVAVAAGRRIADADDGLLVIEPGGGAALYVSLNDVDPFSLSWGERALICEIKGLALFHDIVVGHRRIPAAAWTYVSPTRACRRLADHVAFDLAKIDRLTVGNRRIPPSAMVKPG